MARVMEITNDIPSNLDLEIWGNAQHIGKSGAAIAPSFLHHNARSHILLAACELEELAYENQGKGVFTTALLNLLSTFGTQNLTYANLLQRLPPLTE